MIELRSDQLVFSFPEVHSDARLVVELQRTLRIPDDGKDYSLPPGLGSFPMRHVDDHADRAPKAWLEHGGVMLYGEAGTRKTTFGTRIMAEKMKDYIGEFAVDGLWATAPEILADIRSTFSANSKMTELDIMRKYSDVGLLLIDDLENADPASITRWIRQQAGNDLPQMDRIDLYQTPGCGAILSWGEEDPALPA